MKKLLIARGQHLLDKNKPDVVNWYNVYKTTISPNVTFVDRLDIVKFPFKFHNYFPVPTDLSNFNKTYSDVCMERAQELLIKAKKLSKPLLIFYSGGIDSTAVLASFIMAGADKNDIVVALTPASITENPKFYWNHIRGKYRIVSSENFDTIMKDYISVSGEVNDQLMGNELLFTKNLFSHSCDFMFEKFNENNVTDILKLRKFDDNTARLWYSILSNHIKKAPCEVKTVYDFFWWFNFTFKWQCVYFRMLLRISKQFYNIVNDEFVKNQYEQFYFSIDFQKWAMLNPDKKIGSDWKSYKLATKQFIFSFDGDEDYLNNKTKQPSLFRVFLHREIPQGLTSDYIFLNTINLEEFYNSENDFNQ